MAQAALIVVAYLLGSMPFGLWLTRAVKGIDVRKVGSGNIGFTNVWRAAGPPLACLVFALDWTKGFAPALAARWLAPDTPEDFWPLLIGAAAVIGHNWSVFLNFTGGRGVCTTLGVMFAVTPLAAGFTFVVWLLMVLTTGFVSLGSLLGSVAYPAVIVLAHRSTALQVFAVVAGMIIILRHIPNIKRLLAGEENKFRTLPAEQAGAAAEDGDE